VTKTILFRVGRLESAQDYTIPKGFATKSSRAIQTALSNREETPVLLPRARPAEFEVYVYWLYTGEIVTTNTKGMNSYGTTLVRLYILSDYLEDKKFERAVYDILYEVSEDEDMTFESKAINLVWQTLPHWNLLRLILLYAMLAWFFEAPNAPKFLDPENWPDGVGIGDMMSAVERRRMPEEFPPEEEDTEVGKFLNWKFGYPRSRHGLEL
jgi:hypothetical protein